MLLAWDPITQKERWSAPGGGGAGGGMVTTAGNLVLQVIKDGRLVAYGADKDQKLFDLQTGLRGGMGPPGGCGGAGGGGDPDAGVPPPRPKLLTLVLDGKASLQ